MIVIIEEAASDKLLNASAKIETELESNPTDNLIKKSNELVIIPIIPARLAYFYIRYVFRFFNKFFY